MAWLRKAFVTCIITPPGDRTCNKLDDTQKTPGSNFFSIVMAPEDFSENQFDLEGRRLALGIRRSNAGSPKFLGFFEENPLGRTDRPGEEYAAIKSALNKRPETLLANMIPNLAVHENKSRDVASELEVPRAVDGDRNEPVHGRSVQGCYPPA